MTLSAANCRGLDLSGLLDKGTALLVAFARDPGPMSLCVRRGGAAYRRVEPTESLTMYRILIPVEMVERAGAGRS